VRNDGGNREPIVEVQLTSRVSNRSAVGAKIEVRAGSLKQKLETYAASPGSGPRRHHLRLNKRAGPDSVRGVAAGIVQAETENRKRESIGSLSVFRSRA